MPTEVRDAVDGDRAAIAAMLTRAFDYDPVFAWMIPDPAVRARRLPALFDIFFTGDGPPGMRLTTVGCQAATLWRAPGAAAGDNLGLWHAWRLLGTGLLRGKRVGEAIEAHFPREPFWYLHIAGCDPAAQGRGLGRAVVQAGLDRTGGLPVYLETAKERNLPFYLGLGFRVTDEWSVPGGGPRFWSMIRPQH
ncbi:GNAT family N-acetyltransferase [Sphingomonas sp. LT1P40]|uniref:GNAT family N-acetyltransferase n=1 Tax=Alteristakelama amylovorans TaxID=3096166 RepID=UPI002FC968DD